MASLDVRRPAAQEQLRVLGEQIGVNTLPIVDKQTAARHHAPGASMPPGSAVTTWSCSTPRAGFTSTTS